MHAERKHPAPAPELLDHWDPKAFRRVKRDEGYHEPPRCSECGCNQEQSATAHYPTCEHFKGKRFDDEAPVMAVAPVQVATPAPVAEQAPQVVIPEVMPPAAPVAAGSIEVEIDVPAGVSVRLSIKQR